MLFKDYVPFFISEIKEFEKLYDVEQQEIYKLKFDIEDLKKQCFVETATWGLDLWEEFVGLNKDTSKSIEERRSKILAKIRGQGTTTKTTIKDMAQSYTKGNVEVIEKSSLNTFIVKFFKDDISDLNSLREVIQEVKPAHLYFFYSIVSNFSINQQTFNIESTYNRFFLNFRGNIPLNLDGSWLLNGKKILSGYEIGTYKEPLKIKHTNKFFLHENNNADIRTLIQTKNVSINRNKYTSTNTINIKPKINNNCKNINKISLKQVQSLSSKLRREKNLWFLDGSLSLDGNKLLNAQVIEEVL